MVKKESKALVKKRTALKKVSNVVMINDPKSLKAALDIEKEKRAIILDFIQDQLIEGIDYGKIKMKSKKTGKEYITKPALFKPGGEKFCSLLHLKPEFEKDEKTLSMIPESVQLQCQGVIAFVCKLVSIETGEVVAEGRGACTVAEQYGSINSAIKLSEKRSMIDAVLRLGLSDSFTQDEDEIKKRALIKSQKQKQSNPQIPNDIKIAKMQIKKIEDFEKAISKLESKYEKKDEFAKYKKKHFQQTDVEKLTIAQRATFINSLEKLLEEEKAMVRPPTE